jgi:hypothetical protein
MKRVLVLAGVGVGLWLVLLAPAWWWYGELALLQSGVALALSLVPAVATLIWADRVWKNSPEMQLLAALGGSGVRMAIVLGVGAFLYFQYPETFSAAFLVWLLVFYMVFLALEMALLLRPGKPLHGHDTKAAI